MKTRTALKALGGNAAAELGDGPLAAMATRLIAALDSAEQTRTAENVARIGERGIGAHLAALQRLAREYAQQSLTNSQAPAIMTVDLHQLLKRASGVAGTADRGLSRAATHVYHLWTKDPHGVLSLGDVAKIRDHYQREYGRSKVAEVINTELPKVGFNTLPLQKLTRIAAELSAHADADDLQERFDATCERYGLTGADDASVRSRAFVAALVEAQAMPPPDDGAAAASESMTELPSPITEQMMIVELETRDQHEHEAEPEPAGHPIGLGDSAAEPPPEEMGEPDLDRMEVMGQLEELAPPPVDDAQPEAQAQPEPEADGAVSMGPAPSYQGLVEDPTDPNGGMLQVTVERAPEEPQQSPSIAEPMASYAVYAYSNGKREDAPCDEFEARGMAAALTRIASYGVKGTVLSTAAAFPREAVIAVDRAAGKYLHVAQQQEPAGWNEGMTRAYESGLADGKSGAPADPSKGGGFDAAYMQGHEHGTKSRGAAKTAAVAAPAALDLRAAERDLLDGKTVRHAKWELRVNDDADIELRKVGGELVRTASLSELDGVLSDFAKRAMAAEPQSAPAPAGYYTATALLAVTCDKCRTASVYETPDTAADAHCAACDTDMPAQRVAQVMQPAGYVIETVGPVPAGEDPRERGINARRIVSALRGIVADAHGVLLQDGTLRVDLPGATERQLARVERVLQDKYALAYHTAQAAAAPGCQQCGGPMMDIGAGAQRCQACGMDAKAAQLAGPEDGAMMQSDPMAPAMPVAPAADPMMGDADQAMMMGGAPAFSPEEIDAVTSALTHYRNQGVGPMTALDQLSSQYKDLFERFGDKSNPQRHMVEAQAMKLAAEVWMKPAILTGKSAKTADALAPKVNTQMSDAVSLVDKFEDGDAKPNAMPVPSITKSPGDATNPGKPTGHGSDDKDPKDFGAGKPSMQHAPDGKMSPTDLGKDSEQGDNKALSPKVS